jgi:hypothetical protein
VVRGADRESPGYMLLFEGSFGMKPANLRRAEDQIRQLIKRSRGVKMEANDRVHPMLPVLQGAAILTETAAVRTSYAPWCETAEAVRPPLFDLTSSP